MCPVSTHVSSSIIIAHLHLLNLFLPLFRVSIHKRIIPSCDNQPEIIGHQAALFGLTLITGEEQRQFHRWLFPIDGSDEETDGLQIV